MIFLYSIVGVGNGDRKSEVSLGTGNEIWEMLHLRRADSPNPAAGESGGARPTTRWSSHFSQRRWAVVGKRGGNGPTASSPSPSSSTTTPARFVSYIEILSDRPRLWDRYAARGDPDSTMLPKIPFDQFQVGLQYFILTRAQALAAAGGRQLRRRFRLSCKKTQSLLSNLA